MFQLFNIPEMLYYLLMVCRIYFLVVVFLYIMRELLWSKYVPTNQSSEYDDILISHMHVMHEVDVFAAAWFSVLIFLLILLQTRKRRISQEA